MRLEKIVFDWMNQFLIIDGSPYLFGFIHCFIDSKMEETAILLVNNLNDGAKCESIIESYCSQYCSLSVRSENRYPCLLMFFLRQGNNTLFRRLFHINMDSLFQLANDIRQTKSFQTSPLMNYHEDEVITFVSVAVLYINTCFTIRACSLFSGFSVSTVENYINIFNKIMNEMKDKVIRFPALNVQGLLRVNSKRFFPGAIGVVRIFLLYILSLIDSVFIPKLYSVEENSFSFSEEHQQQGIKLLVVIGRDGRFFNIHISENGGLNNCSIYNESALGVTLRCHKRSILNRS